MNTKLVIAVGILMIVGAMVALAYVRPQLIAYAVLAAAGGLLVGRVSSSGRNDRWGF